MASSRKPPAAEAIRGAVQRAIEAQGLRGKRVVVALSGGIDSVVLLHALCQVAPAQGIRLAALHVHHGLSPNADRWSRFCAALCRRWQVPLTVRRVRVKKAGQGPEAAARAARHAAFRRTRAAAIVLAHQLDDQAETVLLNLLRGSGLAGARGMPAAAAWHGRLMLRPLLEVPRSAIARYASEHALDWVEDESNESDRLTRNFLRLKVAPLLAGRFPRWRESLARAARHFAESEASAERLLRQFLGARGLRAPSERRLAEMLRQLTTARGDARVALLHDGAVLRLHRGRVAVTPQEPAAAFRPVPWRGESRLAIPGLGGELHFRRAKGAGICVQRFAGGKVTIGLRAGGERLQPDPRRPRRTLKNLFQEAGVPPWVRERLPLIFCGSDLVWVPGLGVDARYQAAPGAAGILPRWHSREREEMLRAQP